MTLYLYDAAFRPNLAAVKANGGIAINGYLTGKYADTTTQPSQALAAGLGYLPTYEEGPSELVHASRSYGQAVGRKILAAFAAKSLPLDGSVAVYPSVDVNVPDASAASCNDAWLGIRDILHGKVSLRAYAEGAVIDALANAGLLDGPCWLAAPTSWPGFNVDDKHVCVVQLTGTKVPGTDADHIITNPNLLGALWPKGSPYGAEMSLTNTDAETVWEARGLKLWNGSEPTPWEVLSYLHEVVLQLRSGLGSVNAVVADIDKRVAALQAAQVSASGTYDATLTVGAKQ